LKKFQIGPLKPPKIENPGTIHKFYFDLGPKRYLGPRDPVIEYGLMRGAGGLK